MSHLLFGEIKPLKAILLSMLLAVVGLFIFYFFGVFVNAVIFGTISLDIIATPNTSTPEGLIAIRVLQVFQTSGMFIFPVLVMFKVLSLSAKSDLGFRKIEPGTLLLSLLFMVVFIPGINLIASLNALIPFPDWIVQMQESAKKLIKAMLITDQPIFLFANLFVVAVMPALAEEMFFRGLIQRYFIRWLGSIFWGVVLASVVFSAMHMQFMGFIPRVLLGMVFGYLYVWTRSIWIPIIVHFVNNGLAVFLYYLIGKGMISIHTETMGNIKDSWQIGLISLFAALIVLWIIWQRRISATPPNQPNSAQASEDL